jgi:nicotinamidase-related amidase
MKQALLIVDLQNEFINKHTQNIPENIRALLEQNNYPIVIFSKFVNHSQSPFVKLVDYTKCTKSPFIEIVDTLKPWVKKDNVFTKDTFSIFSNPKFLAYLEKNKIIDLTIVGLDTDFCVLADCFNAFDRGYKVTVIADCCASYTSGPVGHQSALKIINNNIGTVI